MYEPLISIKEAAKRIGVIRHTVYKYINGNKLRLHTKFPHLLKESDVDEYAEKRRRWKAHALAEKKRKELLRLRNIRLFDVRKSGNRDGPQARPGSGNKEGEGGENEECAAT